MWLVFFQLLSLGFFAGWAWLTLRWRRRARKGLVLALLVKGGEMSSLQLRDAGGGLGVYTLLTELEDEKLVESRTVSSALDAAFRGGRPVRLYRIRQLA